MKKLLIGVVLLIVLAVVYKEMGKGGVPVLGQLSGEMTNPYPPGSSLHAQQQEFVDRFNADPALRERFAGTFSSKGLYAEMKFALSRGAQSLDGPSLVMVTRAMAAMIPRLPQKSCAKMIRPRNDFDRELGMDMQSALERLPPVHHRNLWDFYLRALKAEVGNAPIVPVDAVKRDRALQHLGEKFQGPFGQRLAGVLKNPSGASDEDACWAINALTHNSTQLDPESAEAMARLIWPGGE
jgi:hypothetical protein